MTPKEYRQHKEITQEKFAELLGITPEYLSELENGRASGKGLAKKFEKISGGKISRLEVLYPKEYS